jgi:uncharacterized protein
MSSSCLRRKNAAIIWRLLALPFLLTTVLPAAAFDCSRAATDIEKAICGNDDARRANDKMEATYFALREQLGEAGRKVLLDSQKHWLSWRDSICNTADAGCLAQRSTDRETTLGATPPGMVPFFKWQKGDSFYYDVTLEGYRFAKSETGAEATYNKWLDALLAKTPFGDRMDVEVETPNVYTHEVGVSVSRIDDRLISATADRYDYSGGAHGNGWSRSINIDRRTGKTLDAKAVFASEGLKQLTDDCRHQIAADRVYEPDNITKEVALRQLDEAYPGVVAEHAVDMARWRFSNDDAVLQFDPYEVGPYAAGPFECKFSIETIRTLARDPDLFGEGG